MRTKLGVVVCLLELFAVVGLNLVGVSPRGSGLSDILCPGVPLSWASGCNGEVGCSPKLCDWVGLEDVA